jgi:hypothetical protein
VCMYLPHEGLGRSVSVWRCGRQASERRRGTDGGFARAWRRPWGWIQASGSSDNSSRRAPARKGVARANPNRPGLSPCCMRRLRAARSWPSSPYPALVLPLCVLASLHIPSLPSRLRRRCDPVASVLALASRPRSPGDPVGDLQPIPSLRQVSLFPGSLPPSQYIPLEPAQPADTRPQTHTLSKQARTMGFFEKLQASMFFPARPAWRTRPAPTGTPWLTGTARTRALPP